MVPAEAASEDDEEVWNGMTDWEKVHKGLYLCLSGESSACNNCPYDAECKEAISIGPSPLRHDVFKLLKELPDIVRCKDCKNAEILPWLNNAIVCKKHIYTGVRPDGFYCADGERRETND